ncbi:hypothetical protein BP00DRAFT_261806 [Aspergillus indologenus CBS 114.80]|uniref:Uncharacterized protein n=1 Tax=Aspergillus indologenus CBS 114.80 TaxID=1450541 RepID=A0A2V5HV58_9EURO|nr:hypothetical protein BP00DRAFT_261806 [Aspergillus indologenus CBS 114.80]
MYEHSKKTRTNENQYRRGHFFPLAVVRTLSSASTTPTFTRPAPFLPESPSIINPPVHFPCSPPPPPLHPITQPFRGGRGEGRRRWKKEATGRHASR